MHHNMITTNKKLTGLVIATAAASFFATVEAAPVADTQTAKVRCLGVNSCKGKADCHTATNGCKGENACKGKGALKMSEKECTDKGGKVEKK